jgi:hypothetical protein
MTEAIALKSLVILFLLWVFVFYCWKDYRMDAFRESVFAVRDKLFLFAAEGGIDFTHPAYTILRGRMNLVVRYAHEFTLARFILAARFSGSGKSETVRWSEALETLPLATKEKIQEFNTRFILATLEYIFFRSFALYVVFRPLKTFFQLRRFVKQMFLTPKVEQAVACLEYEARLEDSEREHERPLVGIGA